MSEQTKKSTFEYIAKNANLGPKEIFKHEMAPYLEIANLNKFEKEKPDDENDMVWIDHRFGSPQRLVLTRRGFISAVQYAQQEKIQEQGKEIAHLKATIQNNENNKKLLVEAQESLRMANQQISDLNNTSLLIGKTTRKNIRAILESRLPEMQKIEEIKNIIKKK